MPLTKTKLKPPAPNKTSVEAKGPATSELGEVLTLAEAAAYLRVSEGDVLRLVQEESLPGRMIGKEWRFLKSALQDWLRSPGKPDFWKTQLGAFKDDPHLEEMLREIYMRRGRPVDVSA